jgi:hypothetical protein
VTIGPRSWSESTARVLHDGLAELAPVAAPDGGIGQRISRRTDGEGATSVGARLVELSARLRRTAPAVSLWLQLSPAVRGPLPDVRGPVRGQVEAILEELAELAAEH